MQTIWSKRAADAALAAQWPAGVLWFAWPRPIAVDIATVTKGPMEVTVDDEGKTRVRHVYTVSAPIAGKVLRISHPRGQARISLHVGDQVVADETVVAVMQPTIPGFIDVRSREELQAAVAAADAAMTLAEAEIRRIEAALEFSRDELQRAQALSRTGTIASRPWIRRSSTWPPTKPPWRVPRPSWAFGAASAPAIAARLIDPASVSALDESQLLHPDTCTGYGPRAQDHPRQRSRRSGGRAFA